MYDLQNTITLYLFISRCWISPLYGTFSYWLLQWLQTFQDARTNPWISCRLLVGRVCGCRVGSVNGFVSVAQRSKSCLSRLIVEFMDDTQFDTHTVGLLWASDKPSAGFFFNILFYCVCTSCILVSCPDCPAFCLYLQHTSQTPMPPAGFEPTSGRPQTLSLDRLATGIGNFEPAIPAVQRLQTYALDHTATGTGLWMISWYDGPLAKICGGFLIIES